MYTRCPSCGAEISFEPPTNKESLPEDYKHRIRCPICGVTIGVKINRPIYTTTTYTPYGTPTVATSFEPVLPQNQAPAAQRSVSNQQQLPSSQTAKKAKPTSAKRSGIGRNVVMMIFSLVFVALAVVGYLINNQMIKGLPDSFSWLASTSVLDGISPIEMLIKDFAHFQKLITLHGVPYIIMSLVPAVLFVLAALNFIVALIAAIGKKYGRAYNLVISIIVCALAITSLFSPFVIAGEGKLVDYFKALVSGKQYLLIAVAALGLLQLIFSLLFLKSLNRKVRK